MSGTMTKTTTTKKRKGGERGRVRVSSQRCFLLLGCLCLIYASLLERIEIEVGVGEDPISIHGVSPDGIQMQMQMQMQMQKQILPPKAEKAAIVSDATLNTNYHKHKHIKPRLEDYIQGWNITQSVNWLLDFSIVGFPKTGTSTLMRFLGQQTDSIFVFDDERCEMGWNQHVPLLRDLYAHYSYEPRLRMGIKCPRDLEVDLARNNYDTFFPNTKFIVGVRHPIEWFQSFYNHRMNNGFPMLPPEKHIGKCRTLHHGVCTDRAKFADHLSHIPDTRRVFLYDVHQLDAAGADAGAGADASKMEAFRRDLSEFLGLPKPLTGSVPHVTPGRTRTQAATAFGAELVPANNSQRLSLLDICDDAHTELRNILLRHASESARWILGEFVPRRRNPGAVTVSSPNYFRDLLEQWHEDPCDAKHEHRVRAGSGDGDESRIG